METPQIFNIKQWFMVRQSSQMLILAPLSGWVIEDLYNHTQYPTVATLLAWSFHLKPQSERCWCILESWPPPEDPKTSSQEAWLKPESWSHFTKPLSKATSTIPSHSMPKDKFQFPKWDGSRHSKCYSEMTEEMSQVIPCLKFFRHTHYVQNTLWYCSWALMPRSLIFTFQSGMISSILINQPYRLILPCWFVTQMTPLS